MGSLIPKSMDDWLHMEIDTTPPVNEEHLEASLDGLEVEASMLQAQFDSSSLHLEEVRQRHAEVLVTAGMLPETGLAAQHPERALSWVVNSINGRVNPDGLTIPLLGAELQQIQLKTKHTEETTLVQLRVEAGELPPLVRELPLPAEAASSLQATFVDGQLHLRW